MNPEKLKETYIALLNDYLFGGDDEAALYKAYEFSREIIQERVGLEEIAAVHIDGIGKLINKVPFNEIPLIISKSSIFLLEFIMNFSLLYKEYFDLWEKTGSQLHEAIKQTGDALTACLDLDETLKIISSLMQKTTGSDSILIYLLKNSHLKQAHTENIVIETLPKETTTHNTLAWDAISDASIKISITPEDMKKYPAPRIKNGIEPSSALAIPLIGKDMVIGAIECYYEIPHALMGVDNNTLLNLASSAARSIENIYQLKGTNEHKNMLTPDEAVNRCKIARRIVLGEGVEGYHLPNKICKGLKGLIEHLDSIKGEDVRWVVRWIEYLGDTELAVRIKAHPEEFKEVISDRYEQLKKFVL